MTTQELRFELHKIFPEWEPNSLPFQQVEKLFQRYYSQNSGKPIVSGSLPLTIVDSEKKLNEYAQKMNLDFTKPQDFALGWRYCFEWLAGRQ